MVNGKGEMGNRNGKEKMGKRKGEMVTGKGEGGLPHLPFPLSHLPS
jgi:hypothetical protein